MVSDVGLHYSHRSSLPKIQVKELIWKHPWEKYHHHYQQQNKTTTNEQTRNWFTLWKEPATDFFPGPATDSFHWFRLVIFIIIKPGEIIRRLTVASLTSAPICVYASRKGWKGEGIDSTFADSADDRQEEKKPSPAEDRQVPEILGRNEGKV